MNSASRSTPHVAWSLYIGRTILLAALAEAAFAQTAPVITSIANGPNPVLASSSVVLGPGSTAVILGTNLSDSTASAAAPGQPVLGGVEVHLVDTACNQASCELVASLIRTSPTRLDFVVPTLPDMTKVWRTRVVIIKNGRRYDGLTAADRVLLDAIYLESDAATSVSSQPVTFTAHFAALQGLPGSVLTFGAGAVTFMDGETPLGMVKLSNVITYVDAPPLRRYDVAFTTSKLTPGKHPIRAEYSGDYSNASRSSGAIVQSVSVPEITIWSTPNPSAYGQTATIGVTLTPSTCTGTVAFYDDASPSTWIPPFFDPLGAESGMLATVTVSDGRALFSTAALIPGNHPISVKYSGDRNCAPLGYGPGNDYPYRSTSHTVIPGTLW